MQNGAEQNSAENLNPYCFQCGGISVTVEFDENGKPLDRLLFEYFISLPHARNDDAQQIKD